MSNPVPLPIHDPVRQRALDRVHRIVLDRPSGLPVKVYLFGSCATGRAHRFSDIEEALEESIVPHFVDLVDLRHASVELKEDVRQEGIRWFP